MTVDALLRPLVQNRDAILLLLLERIRTVVPSYRVFPDEKAEREWVRGVGDMLDLVLAAAPAGRDRLAPAEAEAVKAAGRTRAEQGVPLGAVIRSVRESRQTVMSCLYGTCARSEAVVHWEGLARLDHLIGALASHIEDCLHDGWTARTREIEAAEETRHDRVLDRLLAGRFAREEEIYREVLTAGCDLSVAQALIVVASSERAALFETELRTRFPASVATSRVTDVDRHVVVLVPTPDESAWHTTTAAVGRVAAANRLTVLVGGPCPGATELHSRYSVAASLLPHLAGLAGDRALVSLRDLTLPQLVVGCSAAARRTVERDLLAPVLQLDEPDRTELMVVLVALVRSDFVVKAASRALGRNVKTVYEKRRDLNELLAVDLTCPGDAARVAFAVHSHELENGFPFSGPETEIAYQ